MGPFRDITETMTLADIAAKLKISRSTVSRALNPAKAHLISSSMRKKIQDHAGRMHFVPNRTAQELTRGRSNTIGVILSTVFNSVFFSDYVGKVLLGIYAVLQENPLYNCKLIALPRASTLSESNELVLRAGIDGLLVSSIGDFSADEYERMARRFAQRWKRPVIGLNMACKPWGRLSVVSFDNAEAARVAVTYLIGKGHQRIGLLWADNGSADLKERMVGYRQALEENHIPVESKMMAKADLLAEGGCKAALMLLKDNGLRPTALFCLNDEMAIGAIRALETLKLRCPADVAVMGFDGLELGELLNPRLTTMRQPVREMAEAATRLLLDLLNTNRKASSVIRISAQLVVRDSA